MQSVSADKREGGIGHRDLVRHHDDLGFGLSKPRNCDDRGVYATPVIGTSGSVRRRLDLRPVPVKPDDATTADQPQKAGALGMHQGAGSVAAEQRKCFPSQVGAAPSPAFGRS